jgi:4-hydroxysphinganine ceramide fatty acyl 2-hydroxylase
MRRLYQRVRLSYTLKQRTPADETDWVPREDFHPDETDALADYNRNKFLDLSQPLLMQVWRAKFTKEYYLSQVHNPRHLKESARLFGNSFLEVS